jgi:hypothetical protein
MKMWIATRVAASTLVALSISISALAACTPSAPPAMEAARGRIVDFDDKPLVSVQLEFFSASRPTPLSPWHRSKKPISVSTDAEGAFDLTTLPEGMYFLEIKYKEPPKKKPSYLIRLMPRPSNPRYEIKVRLIESECPTIEVSEAKNR